jgi:hypothetical protein
MLSFAGRQVEDLAIGHSVRRRSLYWNCCASRTGRAAGRTRQLGAAARARVCVGRRQFGLWRGMDSFRVAVGRAGYQPQTSPVGTVAIRIRSAAMSWCRGLRAEATSGCRAASKRGDWSVTYFAVDVAGYVAVSRNGCTGQPAACTSVAAMSIIC